ncbi:hypothetical protein THAOC_24447 [Thalassiosira oceanica]|uniref:Uncharacterized protein n=1 Tax=Thalassiosira oceanica TaxID=159749 RepID=K0RRY8_THAOC|nr:hypothetical protein THAOC_24447 [Thalassiosira oceanica]|eukprot:EJK55780.1 hypothetical protein THAOC_24447 [Thalassiosira oceanica]
MGASQSSGNDNVPPASSSADDEPTPTPTHQPSPPQAPQSARGDPALATRMSRVSSGLSESAGRRSETTTLATPHSLRARRRIAPTCSTRTDPVSCP